MKRGFTLIELLAVIVILAIIATIVTPIVLSIIKNSKVSATTRSAENYLDAVNNTIAKEKINNVTFTPSNCKIGKENGQSIINCDGTKLYVEVSGSVPESGTIKFNTGEVTNIINLKLNNYYVNKVDGKLVITENLLSICTLKSGEAKAVGSKYECEVKKDIKYIFYLLSSNSNGTYNLIMNQNINSDGTPAGMQALRKIGTNIYNLIEWISKEDYIKAGGEDLSNDNGACQYDDRCSSSKYGPITTLNFLNVATSTWTNIPTLNEIYTDEGGKYQTITFTGKARLPYKSELASKSLKSFLYDNIDTEPIPPYGYWSASTQDSSSAVVVNFGGTVVGNFVGYKNDYFGVRPVITVEI